MQKRKIKCIKNIKISQIRDYIYNIKESRNLSPATICKIIAIFKSYFNFLEEDEKIYKNPTRKIRLPKKEKPIPKVISVDEFSRLVSCIKFSPARCRKNYIRDTLIFSILYYCGLRRSELLSLDWTDINLGKNLMFIRLSKNKRGRIIPIHNKIKELLDLYLQQRLPLKNRALFIGEKGNRLTKCSFSNTVNMYLKISGLKKKGYTAHSLRHSFATRLIEKNVNLFMIQRLLGHSSLDSTKIYIHFDNSSYKKAIEQL